MRKPSKRCRRGRSMSDDILWTPEDLARMQAELDSCTSDNEDKEDREKKRKEDRILQDRITFETNKAKGLLPESAVFSPVLKEFTDQWTDEEWMQYLLKRE